MPIINCRISVGGREGLFPLTLRIEEEKYFIVFNPDEEPEKQIKMEVDRSLVQKPLFETGPWNYKGLLYVSRSDTKP